MDTILLLTAAFSCDGNAVVRRTAIPAASDNSVSMQMPFDLANLGFGKWRVELLSDGKTKLGVYRFIYRAEQ